MEKFRNRQLTIRERTKDLLSRMTVDEKIAQLRQDLYGWKCYERQDDSIKSSDYLREYLAKNAGVGCLYGSFRADPWSQISNDNGIPSARSLQVAYDIQKEIMASNRFGIPALFVEEAPHGHQALSSVSYPTNIGKGNSYDIDLISETSRNIRDEMMAKGVHIALVSTLDLARDPRWGRTEECLSEDGAISAKYTEAIVEGFQSGLIDSDNNFLDQPVSTLSTPSMGVVLKHLIGQGDALGGHNSGSSVIGRRELLDIYSPLIHATRNAVGVMAAYNDIDGVPCHSNHYLLNDLLREKHGFQGFVMADGTALDRLADNYTDPNIATKAALTAGIDMSLWDNLYAHNLKTAYDLGLISIDDIDIAAFRVLSIKFLLGLMDDPFKSPHPFDVNAAQEANLQLAESSITMVKNDNNILPLSTQLHRIAVVGPNANSIYNLMGDYTSPQDSDDFLTINQAIKKKFSQCEVAFAEGCQIRGEENQPYLLNEAIKLAGKADTIILVLGGSSTRNFGMKFHSNGAVSTKGINMDSGENVDVASLKLGGLQELLLDKLSALNKPIITVLIQGRPHEISHVLAKSDAVLIGWYPGQRGGEAIANVIAGSVDPTGRLNISYPYSSGQLPVFYNQRTNVVRDYYDGPKDALLPIGYGLSYHEDPRISLAISQCQISKRDIEHGCELNISVRVTNDSVKPIVETLILSVAGKTNEVVARQRQICDFAKIVVPSCETSQTTFAIGRTQLSQTGINFETEIFTGPVTVVVNGRTATFEII